METQDEKLERVLRLVEENNKILRGIRTTNRMSSFVRLIYIGLFIYGSYWAYQQMMPYMDQLKSLVQQVNTLNKTADNAKNAISPEVQKLLDKYSK